MSVWLQRLTKSLHKTRGQPESRFFQLATVGGDGRPRCRTVVFRGLADDNTLTIISDTRSQKTEHFIAEPAAEVCWYFTKTREQFRFEVTAHVLTASENQLLINEQWQKLSDAGKKQFLWGVPRDERDPSVPLRPNSDYVFAPAHFCVIHLKVSHVDYLNLRGNPQHRELHSLTEQGQWHCQAVIP
ncbi:pyridoxamine 5'-phosphate oxidase family protein [Alteromonas sp. CYL-A6]|uniref:pyridoxamine 5'-phosphate oxidase family protein n=1 Tax=Alteromonas nitratireducens TaxID=3390813 RepID=UPI0034A8E6D1